MKIAVDLLKAEHIGVRALKTNLSRSLKLQRPIVVTDQGAPVRVILPYSDVLELLDLIDEVTDPKMVSWIDEDRKTIQSGARGIPVAQLFNKKRNKK